MGKILTLTAAQAQEIKSGLLHSYQQETCAEFQPVTYLGAYEDLRTHILSKCTDVPGAEASISLHRLRKLFYYTDPVYCPKDKLEPLSFGDDFITLITGFKATGNSDEIPLSKANLPISQKRNYILFSALLVIAVTGFLVYQYSFKAPYFFRDDFHSNSVEELRIRGWDIIDFDSSLFYPQDSGVLTLKSARGDYWVRPGDTPYILNAVYRELPKGCFEVTTRFNFHNSLERYQQCGIVLLDQHKTRNHNIRITYAQSEGPRGYQIIKRDHGEATQQWHEEISRSDTTDYPIFIKILRSNNEYKFYAHLNEEDAAFYSVGNITFDFIPAYIALIAFNGYRNLENGPLNTAGSIPARFDWVRVQNCK